MEAAMENALPLNYGLVLSRLVQSQMAAAA
jgi:hypothetical protein